MTWISERERKPKRKQIVNILYKGKVYVGGWDTETPGYEDDFKAYNYWFDLHDSEFFDDPYEIYWCEIPPYKHIKPITYEYAQVAKPNLIFFDTKPNDEES
jgi:hypothetical protein